MVNDHTDFLNLFYSNENKDKDMASDVVLERLLYITEILISNHFCVMYQL